MIIECPECGTKNRIPDTADKRKTYRCGNCRASLTADVPAKPLRPKARPPAAPEHDRPVGPGAGITAAGVLVFAVALIVIAAFFGSCIGDKVEANRNETLEIVTVPNEGLRQVAEAVDVASIGEEEAEVADLMTNTLKQAYVDSPVAPRVGGLSAPQVGVPKRILVVSLTADAFEAEIIVMVNPEIVAEEGASESTEECLSIPREGAPIRITRSKEIEVRYFTLDGVEEARKVAGQNAAVVQHHIDHLNGVLITDTGETANVIPPIVIAACILAVFLFAETKTSLLTGVSETTPEAGPRGLRRLVAAGKEEASGLWVESIAYLLAVGAAEALLLLPQYWGAMAVHGVVLVVLLLRQAQMPDLRARMLLLSLALVPVYRLASAVAVSSTEGLEHAQLINFAIVSAILLLAIAGLLKYRQLDRRQLGIARGNLSIQLLIGLTGAVIGPLLYLMVEPDPLAPESEWGLLVGAVVVILAVASAEELVFRGILQRMSTDLFGPRGLVYVSLMFALIHLGSITGANASIASIPFIFGVALFYGWAVQRTGLIYGVILSHVITNVIFFLVMPWLL